MLGVFVNFRRRRRSTIVATKQGLAFYISLKILQWALNFSKFSIVDESYGGATKTRLVAASAILFVLAR